MSAVEQQLDDEVVPTRAIPRVGKDRSAVPGRLVACRALGRHWPLLCAFTLFAIIAVTPAVAKRSTHMAHREQKHNASSANVASSGNNVAMSMGTAISNVDVTSHVRYAGEAPFGDFTAMAWFKLVHDPDSEKTMIVVGGDPDAPLYRHAHWVYLANDGNTLAMGSLTPGHYIGTGGYLEVGVWHHVALVGNTDPAQLFELYFDGQMVATGQETGTQSPYIPGMVEFGGLTGHDTDHFNGSFCAALIFNRKLSGDEIRFQMHYLLPVTGAWGAWGLQTRTDLDDLSGNVRNMTTTGALFENDPDGPPVSFMLTDPCEWQADGIACDDGDACTTNDACAGGICAGGPALNCDDGNACTDDSCNPAGGCVHADNTIACDDGDACTTNDACAGGTCVGGSPLNCDDGNVCTDDSCEPAAGCVHSDNTNPCDDGDACTTNDACAGGTCVGGSPLNCDDGNACTDDSCEPSSGCRFVNNTALCDHDADPCTQDQCDGNSMCTFVQLVCNFPTTPLPDPTGIDKNRYLSFQIPSPATAAGSVTALQVTLVSLMHPNPPNLQGFHPSDFTALEGTVRYVGPPGDCLESEVQNSTFKCAGLQCGPLYIDWNAALGGATLHVSDQAVIPSSEYEVRQLHEVCQGNEATCTAASDPLTVVTTRWGDVIDPFQGPSPASLTQPNINDIAAVVDKFKGVPTAIIAACADLNPATPDHSVDITDIASSVDAFKNYAYPFPGPTACP